VDDFAASEEAAGDAGEEEAGAGAAEVADEEDAAGAESASHVGEDAEDVGAFEVVEEEGVGDDVEGLLGEVGDGVGLEGFDLEVGFGGELLGLIEGGLAPVGEGEGDLDAGMLEGGGDREGDIAAAAGEVEHAELLELAALGKVEEGAEHRLGGLRGFVDAAKAGEGAKVLGAVEGGGIHDFGDDDSFHAYLSPGTD
jgi:hypothetical protein